MRVFVGTGGFFALYSANELDHAHAVERFHRASAERWALVTMNAVVFETYALLQNRTSSPETCVPLDPG